MSDTISSKTFMQDKAWDHANDAKPNALASDIDGVIIRPLVKHSDNRGNTIELLTTRDEDIVPFVHSYAVAALPGSVRAWVYHKIQTDRLFYTAGALKVGLFDIREDSPTRGNAISLEVGIDNPTMLVIPPYVVHGVANMSDEAVTFINMPTAVYDLNNPDKYRIPYPSESVPIQF